MFYYHHQEDIFQDFSISIMLFLSQIFISFHIMTLLFAIREVLDKTTRKFSERTSIAGFHRYGIKAKCPNPFNENQIHEDQVQRSVKGNQISFSSVHHLSSNTGREFAPLSNSRRPLEQLHKKTVPSYLRVRSSTESTQTGFNT